MINEAELQRKLQTGEVTLDQLLYPGKMLYEANPDSLEIHTMESGFYQLDSKYFILKENEGELIVVCGEASMGKSAFMLKIAFCISKDSLVHIFSLEDSYESIVRRRLSGIINKPIDAIMRGHCKPQVPLGLAELKKYRFFVDDTGGLTVDEICDRARAKHRKCKTKLIVVDHLQVVGTNPSHSRALEIGNITYKLKALAKELKCPVMLASQMNRQNSSADRKNDRKPRLTDLKESSSIEQNADIVLSVYREYRYTKLRPNEADVGILKNRNGPVGEIVLGFAPAQADFYERAEDVV